MKIANKCSYPIVAFGIHTKRGYGDDVTIQPGESADVSGPYLGEMDGGKCFVDIPGEIVCQETVDDNHGYQVAPDYFLSLQSGKIGVAVRYHLDSPESHVAEWRRSNS